jgi:uncharacterized protein YggE
MRNSLSFVRAASAALVLLFAAQGVCAWQVSQELTVMGRLTPTVEAGGWLVVADYGKYLLTNANEFRRQPWFREGASVEATGRVREDVMSIHMEGVPFQARTMRARGGGGNNPPGNASQNTGGQAVAGPGRRANVVRVVVTGEAFVEAQPDTVIVTLAVVTQNASASEAQGENASRTDAVLRAVRAAAGVREAKTSGYSLQPQYAYKEGAPPSITSYIVRNAVNVTVGDVKQTGAVIDAGSRAGANTVEGLSFLLRNDAQARQRALAEATREALAKARTVANALGGSVVRVVEVQEAGAVRPPVPVYAGEFGRSAGTAQAATPVEPGSLEIRAQVQLVAEVETRE